MKLEITATSKEIADLVVTLQDRHELEPVHDSTEFVTETAEGVRTKCGPSVSRTCY